MIWRLAALLIVLALAYAGVQFAWRAVTQHPAEPGPAPVAVATRDALPPAPAAPAMAPAAPKALDTRPPNPVESCGSAPGLSGAAAMNAASLATAAWSVFGRPETGWEIYAPLAAHEIDTACAPGSEGFAKSLSIWQDAHALAPSGVMDAATLKAMNIVWLKRRPFVAAFAHGDCPPPPGPERLGWAAKDEGYLTKPVQLRIAALAAYRNLAAEARARVPSMAADKRLLTLFSGYRDPADDAVRCAKDGDCGTIAKANCSAHRTGLAMDIYLGSAPGFAPESSADANRLYQTRTELYGWLVRNAARFGFVNYPFEPWHWEWTGEAP